jgi:hypothetical protein
MCGKASVSKALVFRSRDFVSLDDLAFEQTSIFIFKISWNGLRDLILSGYPILKVGMLYKNHEARFL